MAEGFDSKEEVGSCAVVTRGVGSWAMDCYTT